MINNKFKSSGQHINLVDLDTGIKTPYITLSSVTYDMSCERARRIAAWLEDGKLTHRDIMTNSKDGLIVESEWLNLVDIAYGK